MSNHCLHGVNLVEFLLNFEYLLCVPARLIQLTKFIFKLLKLSGSREHSKNLPDLEQEQCE